MRGLKANTPNKLHSWKIILRKTPPKGQEGIMFYWMPQCCYKPCHFFWSFLVCGEHREILKQAIISHSKALSAGDHPSQIFPHTFPIWLLAQVHDLGGILWFGACLFSLSCWTTALPGIQQALLHSPGHLSHSIADLMTGCVSKTDVQETPEKGRTE